MSFDDLAAAACSFMARPIRRLRWALSRIRRRTLGVDDLWHEDVPAEVEFWRRYLLTRGQTGPTSTGTASTQLPH